MSVLHGRIPDNLYRLLPYLYALAGVAAIIFANNLLAVISGLALITAGALVWWVRRQYRNLQQFTASTPVSQRSAADLTPERMMQIRWRKSMETGHEVLDSQHKKLFSLGEEMVNAVMNGDAAEVESLLGDILVHIDEHFATEENILSAMRHPLAESHAKIHQELRCHVDSLSASLKSGTMPSRELISFVIFDLINDHLMNEDTSFFEKLSAKAKKIK